MTRIIKSDKDLTRDYRQKILLSRPEVIITKKPYYLSHWVPHGITLFYCLQAYNKRSTSFGRKPLRSAPEGWGGWGRHDPWRVDGEIGSQARNSPISESISSSFFTRKLFKLHLFYVFEELWTDFDHRRVCMSLYNNSVRLLTELLMGYCNLREHKLWIANYASYRFCRT